MSSALRARKSVLLVGAVLAQWAAVEPARADQGFFFASPGNSLNPAPVNPSTVGRWMDVEGLGTRIPAARTPTGQLYNIPLDPGEEPEAKELKESAGIWKTSGFFELGGLHTSGDDRSRGFLNYQDLRSGAYLDTFAVSSEKRSEARFVESVGGGVGRHDQFYTVQFGRYNDWKVTAFYDETPQVFTTTYRSLWNGMGSGSLALASLAPGGTRDANTTQANIRATLTGTDSSELEIVRKKAGARLDMYVFDSWKVYASLTDEKRKGSKPFGAVFGGGGGGGNIEIPESVDYDTIDLAAGLQWNGASSSFNLRASASFFRNDIDTMTVENPLFITLNGTNGLSPASFTQARFDLPPDNQAYNVKGEYARAFPDFYRGNLTATVAIGSMRQNDRLIAPTEFSLAGGTVSSGGVSLANQWNTPEALSRQSAEARIDTRLVDLGFSLRPANGLDVRAKLRYYETDNSMSYQSCNPLTGQWGRLLNDGSGLSLVTVNTLAGTNPAGTSANAYNAANCDLAAARALNLVPVAGNIPIASIPYDYKQTTASLSADYRLGKSSSVNAAIEREGFHREFRERDRTWEDKVKLGYVDRGSIDGMIRVSYEYDRRGGSEYDVNPYQPFYSSSFGPTPASNGSGMSTWLHTIDQFRSFDLADRSQSILNARINYSFLPTLEGAMTLQMKDADYPGELGRTGRRKSNSITLDMSYQAGSTSVVYGFASYQDGSMQQKGVQSNTCLLGNTYYFFSNGQVLNAATGATPPAAPAGTTLVATQNVLAANWRDVCGMASPTSPQFPDSRGWDVASKDRNAMLGVGAKYDFGKAMLDTSFMRTFGRTRIGYAYNAAGLGMTPAQVALAGDGFSDLVFAQNIFNASVFVPINKTVTMRLLVRYESGRIRDWHYDGVAANPLPANNAAYLDAGPLDYRTTLVGILFQVRL
ncbi:MAG: MtrB/PioB family outer membrane beta-barrel protein [Usitatibacter sp.]